MIDTSMKYIGDYGTHWRVKIKVRDRDRITIQFNFSKYGGKENALLRARYYRDIILQDLGQLDRLKYIKSPDIYADDRKTNPIIGIYKTVANIGSKSGGWFNWTARFTLNSKEIKKNFSLNKFGEINAFQKACEIRFKHSGTLIIINEKGLPCLPDVDYKIR